MTCFVVKVFDRRMKRFFRVLQLTVALKGAPEALLPSALWFVTLGSSTSIHSWLERVLIYNNTVYYSAHFKISVELHSQVGVVVELQAMCCCNAIPTFGPQKTWRNKWKYEHGSTRRFFLTRKYPTVPDGTEGVPVAAWRDIHMHFWHGLVNMLTSQVAFDQWGGGAQLEPPCHRGCVRGTMLCNCKQLWLIFTCCGHSKFCCNVFVVYFIVGTDGHIEGPGSIEKAISPNTISPRSCVWMMILNRRFFWLILLNVWKLIIRHVCIFRKCAVFT